ncbi:hypothetical protein E2C01_016416 [Portunus trituberculatus]|uniref:Uncharacterized protein n=1 Tax=Portunus trituberculatus TaxID=210409 RepID=A0A5B7DP22_PORTR|nr:hypothetical protein [Portunus trituberculatus]
MVIRFSLLGSSEHNLISESHICILSYRSNPSSGCPGAEVSSAFCPCQMVHLSMHYADFPWNDYCFLVRDPSLCAEHITEIIVSGVVVYMEAYIPRSSSRPKPFKP